MVGLGKWQISNSFFHGDQHDSAHCRQEYDNADIGPRPGREIEKKWYKKIKKSKAIILQKSIIELRKEKIK